MPSTPLTGSSSGGGGHGSRENKARRNGANGIDHGRRARDVAASCQVRIEEGLGGMQNERVHG
jgi:hypothetical protein